MKSPIDSHRDLVIVLGSLFVFSSLIALFNSFSIYTPYESLNTQVAAEQAHEGILDLQTPQDALAFIHDLLESRAVQKIVRLMVTEAPERIVQLLGGIADKVDRGATNFDLSDLYQLFAGAALAHSKDESFIDKLVKILLGLKSSFYREPFLYVVGVHPDYHTAFGPFVKSFTKAGTNIQRLMIDAQKRLAATKNPERLKLFLSNPLPADPEIKKNLVWEVATAGVPADIALLKKHGFDLNVVNEGKTPLIQATMNNNEPMVRALLQAGVDVNAIPNNAIGSALQQVLISKNLPIELLLRQYGAHE